MAKVTKETNQETPVQGYRCAIPHVGNVGPLLMATLNLLGFTIVILVWIFSTLNVLNDIDSYQETIVHKEN